MANIEPREPMLYGYRRYEVESLADDIVRDRERRKTNPGLYKAALKLLRIRQGIMGAILKSAGKE